MSKRRNKPQVDYSKEDYPDNFIQPQGIHSDPTNDNYCDGPQGPYDPNYNKGGLNVAWIVIGLGFIALMAYFSISGGGA